MFSNCNRGLFNHNGKTREGLTSRVLLCFSLNNKRNNMITVIILRKNKQRLTIVTPRKPVLQTLETINHFLKKGMKLEKVKW